VFTVLSKIKVVQEWQVPQSVKELRSVLDLAGYYRKLVKDCALISKPLTSLRKKGVVVWIEEATYAFQTIKHVVCATPVLAIADFSKVLVVHTDASLYGIRAVLIVTTSPHSLHKSDLWVQVAKGVSV